MIADIDKWPSPIEGVITKVQAYTDGSGCYYAIRGIHDVKYENEVFATREESLQPAIDARRKCIMNELDNILKHQTWITKWRNEKMGNTKIPMNEMETTKMLVEKKVTYYSFYWSTHNEQPEFYLFIPYDGVSPGMQEIRDEFLEKGWTLRLIPKDGKTYEIVNNETY